MVNLIGKITIVYLARKRNYISSAHNKCILLHIPTSPWQDSHHTGTCKYTFLAVLYSDSRTYIVGCYTTYPILILHSCRIVEW